MTEKIELISQHEDGGAWLVLGIYTTTKDARKFAKIWRKEWPKDKLQIRIIRTEVIEL